MADAQGSSKPVIVRVKRKSDQSPLQALWLEINERPPKRPLLDFQKLSISAANPPQEELKIRRVLVQHVETLSSSQATVNFLHYFVHPTSHTDPELEGSSKVPKRALQKENKHDQLLSKARQEHEEFAKSARFEQIWKRRGNKEAFHDDAVDEVCRVYDILRVDGEDTSTKVEQQEELSVEDQESLNKFLPLLREFIPSAAEEIEADLHSRDVKQDSTSEYVYDVYAVKENIDETDESYPFPLVQVDDDEDMFYDGPDNSDYETDDSNAEANPLNDYPEEESSEEEEDEKSEKSGTESSEEEEEKSEKSGTESGEVESDTDWIGSDNSGYHDKLEDRLCEDDMDDVYNDQNHGYCDDSD